MKILIDTHILIGREYNRNVQRRLSDVFELINKLNYQIVIHPLSKDEIRSDKNIPNKDALLSKIETYPVIEPQSSAKDDDTYYAKLEKPVSEQEKNDLDLLYCVYKKEVDLFLTDDPKIIRKAELLDISNKVMPLKDAYKLFHSNMKNKESKASGIPVFSFYKKGMQWYIGEIGNESIFDDRKGFDFIRYLLLNSNNKKDIHSIEVYNLGKNMSGDDLHDDISEKQIEEIISNTFSIDADESSGNFQKMTYKGPAKEITRGDIQKVINKFKKNLTTNKSLTSEERDRIKNMIARLQSIYPQPLHSRRNETPDDKLPVEVEKARINVTRSIKRALAIISEDDSISSIRRYLNLSTVSSGYYCKYKPLPNDSPQWILSFEERNKYLTR